MSKRILIFGGGENQLTLIKAATELGVESVVIDPNPNAPGKQISDHFEVVGPLDYNKTKKIALKYKVDGIVTSQMENPLVLMAQLAGEMGYIFPSQSVIMQCRNKFLMKQGFLKNNIPCAKGILIKSAEVINPEILSDFNFPLIIKPSDAHSSRGVYLVNEYKELLNYEQKSRNFSSDNSIIIEEYIEGPEYSIEAITSKGKTTIIQYTEKIVTPHPYTVEMGHIQPASFNNKQKHEIKSLVNKAIKALGIDNSATHTELKMSKSGPVVIEIGARLGGDYISSYLTLTSKGVNMDKAAIQVALNEEPDIEIKKDAYSYIQYLELPPGKMIKEIKNWKELLKREDIVYANINLKVGDIIPTITDSSKRLGFVLVKGNRRELVIKTAEYYCNQLTKYIILN